jgi:hypothetical protein
MIGCIGNYVAQLMGYFVLLISISLENIGHINYPHRANRGFANALSIAFMTFSLFRDVLKQCGKPYWAKLYLEIPA